MLKSESNRRSPRLSMRSAGLAFVSLTAMAAALSVGSAAQAAAAAPAGTSTLEEIVVHATRVETKLQTTPIAVTAINAQQLEQQTVRNVSDVIGEIPNVSKTSGPTGGNDGLFFIRGIGQVDTNPAGDPGVGTYVDEVYLARQQGASVDTMDVKQIEVLRGPQGTLFGRNTIGGAISVYTADPGSTMDGAVRLTAGTRDRYEAFGAINLPISSTLRARISAFHREQDGWGKNAAGKTFGDVDNNGARAKLVWDATDRLQFKLAGDTMHGSGTPAQTVLTAFNPAANAGAGPGFTPLGVPFANLTPYVNNHANADLNQSSAGNANKLDNSGVSLTGTYRFDWGQLKSISAYRSVKQFVDNDFDGSPYKMYDNFFDTKEHQFSQELQLSGTSFGDRMKWLGGLYYFDEHVNHNNAICLGTNNGTPGGFVHTPSDGCLQNNQQFSLDVKSYAAFGNIGYKLTDQLSLTLGGRYNHEEKKQNYNFFINNSAGVWSFFGFPTAPHIPTIIANTSKSWSSFTPKIGLDYKATDTIFFYGSYAKGFKSGGFNGRPTPGAPIQAYNPETVATYEIGAKTDWLDHKLRVNVSVFQSDYKAIQLLVLDTGSGFFNLLNAGDDRIQGVEVEAVANPASNLQFRGSVGHMTNKYTRLSLGATLSGIGPGAKLPLTPSWTGALSARYTMPTSLGDLVLRGDYNYRSAVFFGAANGQYEHQDGYGLLDLRASLDVTPKATVSVFGLNVANKRYFANAQDVTQSLGVAFAEIGSPSEWGAELSLKF